MSTEENKDIVRHLFDDIANQRNLDMVEQIIAPEFIDTVKRLILLMHTAFPDFRINLEDQIAEGEKVAAMFTASGTHQGITTFLSEGPIPIFDSPELLLNIQRIRPSIVPDTSMTIENKPSFTLPASWQHFRYVGVRVFYITNGKFVNCWGGWLSESEQFTNWLVALRR